MKIIFVLTSLVIVFYMLAALCIFGILFYIKDDKDFCLDSGVCKEGLEVNTEFGRITITKNNCKKYHWIWNEEQNSCIIK